MRPLAPGGANDRDAQWFRNSEAFDRGCADNDLLLAEASLQFPAVRGLPGVVDIVNHHFGHDNTVALDVPIVLPQTLCGRVDLQGYPSELRREFVADKVKVRPAPPAMRNRKQDFDQIGHTPKTVRAQPM